MLPVDILLVRGLAREAAHWGDFVTRLEKQEFVNNVLCVDLPGAGKFNKLTSPISIAEIAEFTLSQLASQTKQPLVVLSVSLGGMVTVEMIKRKPELFKKAYIMNTSFANLSPVYHRLQLHSFKHFFRAAKAKTMEERELCIVKMVSRSSEQWSQVSQEWAQIAELRPMALKNFFRQLIAAATYRIEDKAPAVPVVVMGSDADQMVHPKCSEAFAKHWNLPFYRNSHSGHDICIDDPDWVISKMAETIGS